MKPSDPISGCIHGSPLDAKCHGLTLKQWLVGRALSGYQGQSSPEDMVHWALRCADLVLKAWAQEEIDSPIESQDEALPEDPIKPSEM